MILIIVFGVIMILYLIISLSLSNLTPEEEKEPIYLCNGCKVDYTKCICKEEVIM